MPCHPCWVARRCAGNDVELVKVRGKLVSLTVFEQREWSHKRLLGCFNCSMPAARSIIVITRHAKRNKKASLFVNAEQAARVTIMGYTAIKTSMVNSGS